MTDVADSPLDLTPISQAERQFVLDRLRDEAACGRLSLDDFDDRAGSVYTVRTRGDLLALLPPPSEQDDEQDEPNDDVVVVIAPAPQPRRWRWRR